MARAADDEAVDESGALAMAAPSAGSRKTVALPRIPRGVAIQLDRAMEAGRIGTWQLDLDTGRLVVSALCKANYGLPADADFSIER